MAKKVVVSYREVENAIFDGINKNRELRRVVARFIDDVHDTWITIWEASGPHPYETGDYVASIKKRKLPMRSRIWMKRALARGALVGAVYSDSPVAHFIEYGTDVDYPESKSPWGPNTPTPEFSPMRRTQDAMRRGLRVR